MKILKITTHWTAEEADAIYQCLDDLKDAIWQCYGEEMINLQKQKQYDESKVDDDFFTLKGQN